MSNRPQNTTSHINVGKEQQPQTSVRVMGAIVLFIELGILFVYGFQGSLLSEIVSWGGLDPSFVYGLAYVQNGSIFYFVALIFALIGFGCLFASLSKSTLSGFFVSFFVVGFTTIFSPIMQKFWFNVFEGGFSNTYPLLNSEVSGLADFLHYGSGSTLQISYYVMRISLLNAISQLIVFYALYQRLNAGQIFFFSIFYQVAFTLNYYLNVQVSTVQPDSVKRFFDDYAINQVFLFGAVFGLMVSLICKKPPASDLRAGRINTTPSTFADDQVPLIVSLIGTFLLFISFMSITLFFTIKVVTNANSMRNSYFSPQQMMNILFALSACVFTNMFLSSVIRQKLGLREIHFGMIGGAIICGPIAGVLDNFGAMIALGTFAGIISALYFGYLHGNVNSVRIVDAHGIVYILIVSLVGTMLVAPVVYAGMVNNSVLSNILNNVPITDIKVAGWALVYVGISTAIALVSGLFMGLFLRCFEKEISEQFEDRNIFDPLPGLNDEAYKHHDQDKKDNSVGQSGIYLKTQGSQIVI